MAQGSKTGLIILIIFCVVFAGTASGLLVLQQQEQAKRVELENKIKDFELQRAKLQEKLDEAIEGKNSIELELSKLESKAELLADKIKDEKRQKEAAESRLKSKESEVGSLKGKLEKAELSLSDLKRDYAKLEADTEETKEQLNQIRLAKRALEAKMGTAGTTLEGKEVVLGKVVVRPEILQSEGRVLVVNKEFNFVVIDLGLANGVKPGTHFGIYRGGELLAEVEVEKVYEDMCSAVILSEGQIGEILEDDQVEML